MPADCGAHFTGRRPRYLSYYRRAAASADYLLYARDGIAAAVFRPGDSAFHIHQSSAQCSSISYSRLFLMRVALRATARHYAISAAMAADDYRAVCRLPITAIAMPLRHERLSPAE